MSDISDLSNEDDPAILGDDDDDESGEHVKLDEEDEMLLLSSPSSGKDEEDSSPQPVGKPEKEKKNTPKTAGQLASSDNIVVEDSESEEDFENTDNSVEVIGSEDESLSEGEEEEEEEEEDVEDVESSSAYLDGKVQIFLLHGSLFLWNADDVRMLREECRIIGKLSGCLPRAPRQNNQLGLPLQLMPEEAKLLEEIEAACVVEEIEVNDEDEQLRKTAFEQTRRENFKIQQKLYKESRKEEIAQHMDKIVAGKRAKKRKIKELGKNEKSKKMDLETSDASSQRAEETLNSKEDGSTKNQDEMKAENDPACPADIPHLGDGIDQADTKDACDGGKGETTKDERNSGDQDEKGKAGETKEDSTEDQSDSSEEDIPNVGDLVVGETDIKHSFVQIFTENPWHRDVRRCKNWVFPLSQKDRLRYAVFRDLWRKGYYLTSGSKFGGDFLVYPGDPARFHSHYIAICIEVSEDMSVLDMVSMARLASNVRKTALICSYNKFRKVSYLSLQWTGMV